MKRFFNLLTASVLGLALVTTTALAQKPSGHPGGRPNPGSSTPRPMQSPKSMPAPRPVPMMQQPVAKPPVAKPPVGKQNPGARKNSKPQNSAKPAVSNKKSAKSTGGQNNSGKQKTIARPAASKKKIAKPADVKKKSAKPATGKQNNAKVATTKAHQDFRKELSGKTSNQPKHVKRADNERGKPVAPMDRGVDRQDNYHQKCGTVFPKGHSREGCYFYHGWDHCHWTSCRFDQGCGCNVYWCPWTKCSYYWCAPDCCYYPVDYVPYGSCTADGDADDGDAAAIDNGDDGDDADDADDSDDGDDDDDTTADDDDPR